MEQVLQQFCLDGTPISCEPLGNGHINRTFRVTCSSGRVYTLQRINRVAFRHPEELIENIDAVSRFIAKKNTGLEMIRLCTARGGRKYAVDAQGEFWRAYDYISGGLSLEAPRNCNDFYQAAVAFGKFQQALADFPAATLHETIPRFHDTEDRLCQLRASVEADACGRVREAGPELAFISAREQELGTLCRMLRSGAPLSTRQQISLTLQLSWPAIMAQLATIIMQYIDAAMVGRLGASQSAAVGLVASTTWLFGGLSYAAAMGFNVLTAQRVGGGRLAEARNILKQALVLCLAFSVVMAALAAALSAPLPRLLRAEQEIWRDASAYFLVYSLFLPALQLDNVAAGQLQATGNMRTPGVCMVLMCALDVVFNTLLIFPTGTIRLGALSLPGAGLGTAGAALGTGLAELAVGLYLLYFVLRRSPALRLEKGERLHLDRTQLRMVLRIAAPVASEKVILSTAQIVSTAIVAPLGTVAIAANSFAVTAESLCYMPAYGIQSAAAMLVGQSVGAGRRRMARRLGWVTVLLGIVVMVVTGGLLYAFAPQMMAILTPDSDIIALGTRVLRIEAFAEAMYGASIVAGGVFQGAGSTLVPTLFNLGTMWGIRLPLAWLAAPRWGLPGVWAAMCAELCVRGLLYLIRLGGKRWLPPEGPAGQV